MQREQVLISTAQCTDFVFLLHNDQCVNQEQSSVVGRRKAYHGWFYTTQMVMRTEMHSASLALQEQRSIILLDTPMDQCLTLKKYSAAVHQLSSYFSISSIGLLAGPDG